MTRDEGKEDGKQKKKGQEPGNRATEMGHRTFKGLGDREGRMRGRGQIM